MTLQRLGTHINHLWRPVFVTSLLVAFIVNAILLPLLGHAADSAVLAILCTTTVPYAVLRTTEKHLGLVGRDAVAQSP